VNDANLKHLLNITQWQYVSSSQSDGFWYVGLYAIS